MHHFLFPATKPVKLNQILFCIILIFFCLLTAMICTCKKSSVHGERVAEMAKEMCVTRPCRPTGLIAVGGRWGGFSCTWRF